MDAGFGSVSQFHHVFRAIIGVTPREYAKARGNE
jgi:AraC-like DNA-binding protein